MTIEAGAYTKKSTCPCFTSLGIGAILIRCVLGRDTLFRVCAALLGVLFLLRNASSAPAEDKLIVPDEDMVTICQGTPCFIGQFLPIHEDAAGTTLVINQVPIIFTL